MPKIQRLPPEVVNRIAAGEVIERPASIVKELLENAIDAGATEILVDVEEGGTKRITVRDNGCGMSSEDLSLAFESHATSKIRPDDFESSLFGIETLGFRGEALPSIASVADVEVVSKTADAECAYRLKLHGGRAPEGDDKAEPEPTAGEDGTVVEVRELFFNVPARRKFLRSASAELSRIVQQVTRVALAHPDIRFLVTHGGRRSLDLPAVDSLQARLLAVVGKEKARDLLEVDQPVTEHSPGLHGFVSSPKLRRGDSRLQNFFVNGRWVKDRLLTAALRGAYQGFLIPGNHPVAYLFLEFPTDAVDVNVHPQKSEVRFRDPGMLYPLIYNGVKRTLEFQRAEEGAEGLVGRPEESSRDETDSPARFNAPTEGDTGTATRDHIRQAALDFLETPAESSGRSAANVTTARPVFRAKPSGPRREVAAALTETEVETQIDAVPETDAEAPIDTRPKAAFQVLDSYLVVDDGNGDGLTVIDQHALHEKILFEEIHERLDSGEILQQKLMVPEIVSLAAEEVPLIDLASRLLASCGYEIEAFGDAEVAIHAVPEIFERRRAGSASNVEIVRDIFRWLLDEGETSSPAIEGEKPDLVRKKLRDMASLMACKRAVKAGMPLSEEEIETLLERADLADDPRHCPHGRPTTVQLSLREIERKFDRK